MEGQLVENNTLKDFEEVTGEKWDDSRKEKRGS